MGCDVVKVYKDHGISGAKGRDTDEQWQAIESAYPPQIFADRGGLHRCVLRSGAPSPFGKRCPITSCQAVLGWGDLHFGEKLQCRFRATIFRLDPFTSNKFGSPIIDLFNKR